MTQLKEAWLAGRTVRKHTMHVHRRENIAEHTWGMLMLCAKYLPQAELQFILFIILHDAGEQGACDMPYHVCRDHPELHAVVSAKEKDHVATLLAHPHETTAPELPEQQLLAVEILDRAEFVLGCWYELEMGNRLVLRPMQVALDKITATLPCIEPASSLHTGLQHLYTDLLRILEART